MRIAKWLGLFVFAALVGVVINSGPVTGQAITGSSIYQIVSAGAGNHAWHINTVTGELWHCYNDASVTCRKARFDIGK